MERWKLKVLCNEAPFSSKRISPSFEPETQWFEISVLIYLILGLSSEYRGEKRCGAVEDIDSSALIISSWCALYVSVILGKPEVHPIFGGKKLFKNITRQILNFILESYFAILCSDNFFFLSVYPATVSLAFCII